MKPIRNSAKAIVIEDGKLLCTKNSDHLGVYYLLPGGGQNPGENLAEALKRECQEEISSEIEVHDLRYVRDYISNNHDYEFADENPGFHQVELMFRCSLVDGEEPATGETPDGHQIGVEWLPLDRLSEYRLYPKALIPYLMKHEDMSSIVYIGDVN